MSSKLILFLTMIGLAILLIFGITDPNSPVVWLASTSSAFAWLRAGLIAILFGLLITNPPRNVYFRMFVGSASMALAIWAFGATFDNQMKLLDGLSLLAFSVCAGLAALEQNYEEVIVQINHTSKKRSKKAKANLATA